MLQLEIMEALFDKSRLEEFLRHSWAFELMKPEQLRELADMMTMRRVKKGEILWLQGQEIPYFLVVYSGRLKSVRRTSSGSEKLVSFLGRGHHFGLAEMITGATSALTLVSDEESVILRMDYKLLKNKLLSDVEICFRLMQTMARAIFRLTRELERASFETVQTRLARLLLRRDSLRRVPLGMISESARASHEELAVQIGVSRETVSRVLSEFKSKGLIETGYRKIKVVDRESLMEYVEDYDQW